MLLFLQGLLRVALGLGSLRSFRDSLVPLLAQPIRSVAALQSPVALVERIKRDALLISARGLVRRLNPFAKKRSAARGAALRFVLLLRV